MVNYFFGGMTPANEPLVEPRIGTGDLYTLDLKSTGGSSNLPLPALK